MLLFIFHAYHHDNAESLTFRKGFSSTPSLSTVFTHARAHGVSVCCCLEHVVLHIFELQHKCLAQWYRAKVLNLVLLIPRGIAMQRGQSSRFEEVKYVARKCSMAANPVEAGGLSRGRGMAQQVNGLEMWVAKGRVLSRAQRFGSVN